MRWVNTCQVCRPVLGRVPERWVLLIDCDLPLSSSLLRAGEKRLPLRSTENPFSFATFQKEWLRGRIRKYALSSSISCFWFRSRIPQRSLLCTWSIPAVVSLKNTMYLKMFMSLKSTSFACCLAFGKFQMLFAPEAGGVTVWVHWGRP